MGFSVDDQQRPILVVTWQGETTVDDVNRFAAWLGVEAERARSEHARVAIVSDAVAVTRVGAEARKAFAAWRRRFDPRDVVVGNWIVSQSPIIRGVTSAVRWVNPSMTQVHMVKSVEHGIAEARAVLDG